MSKPAKKSARERLLDTLADRAPKSGRGLWGCEFTDTIGARVRCSDSSAADEPRMWLWVDGGEIKNNHGSVNLSQQQAAELAEVLLKFSRDGHLRLGTRGERGAK